MVDPEEVSPLLQPIDDGLPMSPFGIWAKDKLDILAHYITTSTIAMKDLYWRRRFYIDLQAGPGKNFVQGQDDGTQVMDRDVFLGSPLLALTRGAGYTDYRFVEQDETRADALRQRCQPVADQTSIQVIMADCNEAVDEIVSEIDRIDVPPFSKTDWNTLSLAFLDPEGLELNWDTVLKLATLRRTDLLINFSIGGLRRCAEQAFALPIGEAQADRFFGTPSWRSIPRNPDGSMPSHQWIEFYKDRITELGYLWGTARSVKNTRGVELYRLLFASKHELGIKFWEEARKKAPPQRSLF